MKQLPPRRQEIEVLFKVARRELSDSDLSGLSNDGRFEHAYAAALAIATVAIRATGLRIPSVDHHKLTFEALTEIANGRWREIAAYLQHCRKQRNLVTYERAGVVSDAEANELRQSQKSDVRSRALVARGAPRAALSYAPTAGTPKSDGSSE